MTKQRQIAALLKRIDKNKVKVQALRDELRQQHSDLEDIIESLDSGIEDFDSGLRQIDSALDTFSQYL